MVRQGDQLLVECSDPGTVVFYEETLENVLRHVDFERANAIRDEIASLAAELGETARTAWARFRIETPNDSSQPLTYGARDAVDKDALAELLTCAEKRGVGRFSLGSTLLLPQHGPVPETREQYIRDLADAIRFSEVTELDVVKYPTEWPPSLAVARQQIVTETAGETLRRQAERAQVGYRWVDESVKELKSTLEEADSRFDAVAGYELGRLAPDGLDIRELRRWAALSVRVGRLVEKWCLPLLQAMEYPHQRASALAMLWSECGGARPARPFLEQEMENALTTASAVYTRDGTDAVRLMFDDLKKGPWGRFA